MKFLQIIALFFFISCSSDSSHIVTKERLRVNLGKEPMTLDPRKARDLNTVNLCRVFFDGLTRISQEGKPIPSLAEKIEVSKDGKKYLFKLREAYWSDGEKVTSYDFAYSWRSSLSPTFPSPCAGQLFIIRGAREAKEGKIPLSEIAIETPDEKTLAVELDHVAPYFLEILAIPIAFAVPKKAEEAKSSWASEPKGFICNGPFSLKEWKHQDSLLVEKNFRYWDEKNVKLSSIFFVMVSAEVELSLFEAGELDWAGSPFSTLPFDALRKWKTSPLFSSYLYSGTYFLRINTSEETAKEFLGLPAFRKALSESVDRLSITQHVLPGGQLPATVLVPPSLLARPKPEGHEVAAATLLQETLKNRQRAEEKRPLLTLSYVFSEGNHLVAQALQRQWKEALGLKIVLQAVEPKLYYDALARGKYQLALSSWIADINDAINFLEVFKYKEGATNHTFWQEEKYIQLLDASDQMEDLKKRELLLQEAQELLLQEMPIIPLYQAALCYLKRKEVEGVYVSSLGHIDFKWAEIK